MDLLEKFVQERHLNNKSIEDFQLGAIGSLVYNKMPRLVIPINNLYGDAVGFAFRKLIDEDQLPKYINTVFNKSEHLYGLFKAWESIVNQNMAIVVEGYFDTIISHQYDITNVVAMCGGGVTYQQALLLRRFTSRLIVLYDSDVNLSSKPIYTFFDQFKNIKMPSIDPDEFLIKYGKDDLLKYINDSIRDNRTDNIKFKLESMKC